MKPVKKDAPRQERRKRTLSRLENYLQGGVKVIKVEEQSLNKGAQPGHRLSTKLVEKTVPFEQKDIDRIKRDIAILKSRLGKSEVVDGYKRV